MSTPFDVVVIGASAGGVEALSIVVNAFPAGFPAAILVVQHMDPRHKSVLHGLLGRRCWIPVAQAIDGDGLHSGTVSIAPPDLHLLVRGDRLRLESTAQVHFTRPSVDLLFESVADAYGERVIGVVLSGSGLDGAAGVRAIKAKGGTTIVQDPATAAHRGMPDAARNTGCADFVLPLDEIGPAIVGLVVAPSERSS